MWIHSTKTQIQHVILYSKINFKRSFKDFWYTKINLSQKYILNQNPCISNSYVKNHYATLCIKLLIESILFFSKTDNNIFTNHVVFFMKNIWKFRHQIPCKKCKIYNKYLSCFNVCLCFKFLVNYIQYHLISKYLSS